MGSLCQNQANLSQISTGFLDATHVAVLGNFQGGSRRHVARRPSRNVVQHNRLGSCIGHGVEVLHNAQLRGLVVRWRCHQKSVDAFPVPCADSSAQFQRVVARHPNDHRHPTGVDLHHEIHHAALLLWAEGWRLRSGSEHHQEIAVPSGQVLHHALQCGEINSAVDVERGDQGHAQPLQFHVCTHWKSILLKYSRVLAV